MIGTSGRSWDMSRAENPDCVNATITLAPRSRAAWRAASEIASGKPTTAGRRRAGSGDRTAPSARSAMRAIVWTASAG